MEAALKLEIIMDARLGLQTIADLAEEHEVKQSTLRAWVKNYKPPSDEVIEDLLKEAVVKTLRSIGRGSEFSGVITAMKHLGNDPTDNLTDLLLEFARAKNPEPELTEEELK